jgi:hypothetical protein|tara:strand:- start:323 stop:535 length:213 start_codon:yes stop_codon:yes gene_type:complete
MSKTPLVDTIEASSYLGLKPKTLINNRNTGKGVQIPFIKIGKAVRYKVSVLEAFIEENTFNNTGECKELR